MRKWLLLPLLLVGCSTPSLKKSLDQITTGMDKDKVLERAGNPKRTNREQGQDIWTYVYYVDDRELRRDVIFEDGKVVGITRAAGKEEWEKDLEKTNTMEEYEQKAHEHEKRANDFEPVN